MFPSLYDFPYVYYIPLFPATPQKDEESVISPGFGLVAKIIHRLLLKLEPQYSLLHPFPAPQDHMLGPTLGPGFRVSITQRVIGCIGPFTVIISPVYKGVYRVI